MTKIWKLGGTLLRKPERYIKVQKQPGSHCTKSQKGPEAEGARHPQPQRAADRKLGYRCV